MKRVYAAPTLQVELYELDTSIAVNCAIIITLQPHEDSPCSDVSYESIQPSYGLNGGVSFVDNGPCDCYTTAGGEGYWMS